MICRTTATAIAVLAAIWVLPLTSAHAANEIGDPNAAVVDVFQANRQVDVDPGDKFWLTVPASSGLDGLEVHRAGDQGWTWLKAGQFLLVQYDQPGDYTIRFRAARPVKLAPLSVHVFAPPAELDPKLVHGPGAGELPVGLASGTSPSFSLASVYAGLYAEATTNKFPLRIVSSGAGDCVVLRHGGGWSRTYSFTAAGEQSDLVDVPAGQIWTLIKVGYGTHTLSTNSPGRLSVKNLTLTSGPAYAPVGQSVTNRCWDLASADTAVLTVLPGPFWVTNSPSRVGSAFEWSTNGFPYTPLTGLSSLLRVGQGSNEVAVHCHAPLSSATNQLTYVNGLPTLWLAENSADRNGNRIPDFAEGYTDGYGGSVSNMFFTPLLIDLTGIDSNATVSFSYASSDPGQVYKSTHYGCSGNNSTYTPAPGSLRLWTKDGDVQRNSDPIDILGTGDFIATNQSIALSVLPQTNGQLLVYAEGVRLDDTATVQVSFQSTGTNVTRTLHLGVYGMRLYLQGLETTNRVGSLSYQYQGLEQETVGELIVPRPAVVSSNQIAIEYIVPNDHGLDQCGYSYPPQRPSLYSGDELVANFNSTNTVLTLDPATMSSLGTQWTIRVQGPLRGYFAARYGASGQTAPISVVPPPEPPSLSLSSKYRRVNRLGVALPDPSPTGEGEEDRLPDQAHIDMFSLTPTYTVSDVRVPGRGGELSLEFRRTASLQSIELDGDSQAPYVSETILGHGWSSSLGSRITVNGPATNRVATVVDELGNAYRYRRKPAGDWEADTRHSFNNDAIRGRLRTVGTDLVFERTFGTKLTYGWVQETPCVGESYYRLLNVQDRNGNSLQYAYGPHPLLTSSITESATGRQLQFQYSADINPRLERVIDPLGRTNSYVYHPDNRRLIQVQYPAVPSPAGGWAQPTVQFEYYQQDALKKIKVGDTELCQNSAQMVSWIGLSKVTDARGASTQYGYTLAGQFPWEAFALRADGQIMSMQKPHLVSVLTLGADNTTNTVSFERGTGNSATNIINTVVDARNHRTRYEFTGMIVDDPENLIGKALRIGTVRRVHENANNATAEYHYSLDRFDNLTSVRDLSGNTVSYGYATTTNQQFNLPSHRLDALGYTNRYQYSTTPDGSFNKQQRVTDAEGVVTEYQFDARGNRTAAIEGSGTRTNSFVYDSTGTLISSVLHDLDGDRVTDLAVNSYGDVITNTTYTGYGRTGTALRTILVRDPIGKVLSQTDPNGNTTLFAYDDLDRKTSQTNPAVPGAPAGSTATFHHDLNGNLVKTVDDNGQIILAEFDPLNRPIRTIVDMNRNGAADAGDLVSAQSYDPVGNLASQTDPNGKTTTFDYDALLRLTTKTFPAVATGVHTESYQYGANAGSGAFSLGGFQPTIVTNKRGQVTINTYDAAYRLTKTERLGNGAHPTAEYAYNRVHKKTREIVHNDAGTGHQTNSLAYDSLYRVIATTNALGFVTRQSFDKAGNVLTVTDAENHTTVNTYDGASRLLQTRLPVAAHFDPVTQTSSNFAPTTAIGYDLNGNKTQITDPHGTITRLFYDARNRLTNSVADFGGLNLAASTQYDLTTHPIAVTDPRGHTTETVYDNAYRVVTNIAPAVVDAATGNSTRPLTVTRFDANGNVLTVTDPRGVVTKTDYDAWNRPTQVIRAFGTSVAVTNSTTYDANNNVLTVTLHNGGYGDQTTTYTFDPFDRKTTETLPAIADGLTRRTRWTYFQNGAVAAVTDAKDQVVSNQYDRGNRLTQVQFLAATNGPVTETRTFSYNNVDKPLVITDAAGTTTNSYDALYRLVGETRVNGTNDAYTVANFFDQAGNRTKVVYPGTGRVLLSQYDALNRLSQIADGTNVTTYGYDSSGNRIFQSLPNGQATTNVFDALNRVTNMVTQAGASNVYSVGYAYDLIGNRLSAIEDLITQGVRTNSYVYDDQYRLVGESSQSSVLGLQSTVYTFDSAGNRLSLTKINGDSTNLTTYAYDPLNRLTNATTGASVTTYAYDLNGSRIEKLASTTGTVVHTTYQYDTANRLIRALDQDSNTIFTATYDYRTRRVSVQESGTGVSPVQYRYDSGDCFQEMSNAVVAVEFVRGSGMGGGIGSILYTDRGTNREHFAYNAVGHTVALTLSNATISKTDYYDAYGGIVSSTGQSENNRLANTKERSFTLGLDNHGFRYFDPEVGRYITRDPIGYGDGLNVYIYVHNNPINHVDPLGLSDLTGTVNDVESASAFVPQLKLEQDREESRRWQEANQTYLTTAAPEPQKPTHYLKADTRGRDAARYFRNQALTLGSNLDPVSPIADQIASQNANMILSAAPYGVGNAVMAYNGVENISRINSQNGLGENLFYGGLAALNFYGASTYQISPPAWTAPAPTLQSVENSILVNAAHANYVTGKANVPRSYGRFGTAAHKEFEAANVQLNSELSGTGFRVAAEEFRNASGGVVARRSAGSLGVDAVVYRGTTPVVGFDLKTGAGWGANTVSQVQSRFGVPVQQIRTR